MHTVATVSKDFWKTFDYDMPICLGPHYQNENSRHARLCMDVMLLATRLTAHSGLLQLLGTEPRCRVYQLASSWTWQHV